MSLDALAGRKESISETRIRNPELHELYQHADQLSDEEPRASVVLLDSLMKRSQIDRIMGSKRASPRSAKSGGGLAA